MRWNRTQKFLMKVHLLGCNTVNGHVKSTDVREKHIASTFSMEKQAKQETNKKQAASRTPLATCFFFFLAWLILRLWSWKQYVPPICWLTSSDYTALHLRRQLILDAVRSNAAKTTCIRNVFAFMAMGVPCVVGLVVISCNTLSGYCHNMQDHIRRKVSCFQ